MFALRQCGRFGDGWTLSKSCLLGDTALVQYGGSTAFLTRSSHRSGTLFRLSARLSSDLTRTASTDNPYSLTKLASASSRRLIRSSLATLVRPLAFPVRVSVNHLCTLAVSVWRCNRVVSHISAMFTLFSTASSSAKFTWCGLSPFVTSSHPPRQLHHAPVTLRWLGNLHQPKRRT